MIQEQIDSLLEKGKKRTLKYDELLARKKARVTRLEQLSEAKTYLMLYFARAFSVNFELSNTTLKALLMSCLSQNDPSSTSIPDKMKGIFNQFEHLFGNLLDEGIECLNTRGNDD